MKDYDAALTQVYTWSSNEMHLVRQITMTVKSKG
jgi:hypothetical protein